MKGLWTLVCQVVPAMLPVHFPRLRKGPVRDLATVLTRYSALSDLGIALLHVGKLLRVRLRQGAHASYESHQL